MSIKAMSWVWETSLKGAAKLMLLAIADHCNDEGENAYPGLARLARKCSVTERTAQRTISNLEMGRMLHVEENAGTRTMGGQWTNRYTLIGYKADVLNEDISRYRLRERPDKNVTPSRGKDPTPASPLDPTPASPLDPTKTSPLRGKDPTPASPESSENHQPSVINHQNQSSVSDDDDDNLIYISKEIVDILGKPLSEELIAEYGVDRVLHGCQLAGERAKSNKRGYARSVIVSGDEMAPLESAAGGSDGLAENDPIKHLADPYAPFIEGYADEVAMLSAIDRDRLEAYHEKNNLTSHWDDD